MRTWARVTFFLVFGMTGFAALTLQVVWQRVISLHAGVDLVSFTTVVSAFLAGIGIGSLIGGSLADRLGPRRSVGAFALSNVVIGIFSFVSVWLFYDVYEKVAPSLTSTASKFAFNFVLLLVPTTLMGLSLPLVAKGLVQRVSDAGPLVGRLYSVNTIGAAVGAAVAGWYLMGTFGFTVTAHVAGSLNLLATVLVIVVYATSTSTSTSTSTAAMSQSSADATAESESDSSIASGKATGAAEVRTAGERIDPLRWGAGPWYVIYGLTGAVALGFEVVFFRMIDTIMRSNSYSFAHVLSMYLLLFGIGAAVASPIVKRAKRPEQWFLWLQFLVGLFALAGIIFFVDGLPRTGAGFEVKRYLGTDGYALGFRYGDGSVRRDFLPIFFGVPIVVLGAPVLCMGASFPFVQALVNRRMDTLGRHTGTLVFANVAGNVLGTLLVGFFVVDALGTSGTYRVLALALLVPALGAAVLARSRMRGVVLAAGAVALMALLIGLFPSNEKLYANLHGAETDQIRYAEDRSCTNTLRSLPNGDEQMTINGSSQNGYPFDAFHVLIGSTPALMHPHPRQTMALGMGIGATSYGMSLDPRTDQVDVVEICGPQFPLLKDLGDRRSPELRRQFKDPKVAMRVGDGRDFLLRSTNKFDVIVVDTLRQHSAFSGNLYSKEFYELVRDRLNEDGMVAQWIPTQRTVNSVLEVFPYAVIFNLASYSNSTFFVASKSPIKFDREAVLQRLSKIDPATGVQPAQLASMSDFYENAEVVCTIDPAHITAAAADQLNSDLHPRDEYFLNNDELSQPRSSCVGQPP